jgi:hypothetical protein
MSHKRKPRREVPQRAGPDDLADEVGEGLVRAGPGMDDVYDGTGRDVLKGGGRDVGNREAAKKHDTHGARPMLQGVPPRTCPRGLERA